jgi:hypothetical protein
VPWRWRIVLIVIALLVGVELVSSTFTGLVGGGNGASGPASSFDSSSSGTEALAQLLALRGHRVHQLTDSLGSSALPRHSAVFVLDPTSWNASDTRALVTALSAGNQLIIGGRPPAGVLRALLGKADVPSWRSAVAGSTHPVSALPLVTGVTTVLATGRGVYVPTATTTPSGLTPLLAGPEGDLALVGGHGGSIVLLGSSSPLRNGSLARADNAALALHLVASGAPVVFDEYDHGFGQVGAGLAGLPAAWRWGLAFALLAIVVWVVSAARRFGPPDQPGRITVPPRVRYVDAMATLLSSRPPDQVIEAVAPVRVEARHRLCRRLGLPTDVNDDAVARRLADVGSVPGLTAEQTDVILRAPSSIADAVALGTVLAQLEGEDRYR